MAEVRLIDPSSHSEGSEAWQPVPALRARVAWAARAAEPGTRSDRPLMFGAFVPELGAVAPVRFTATGLTAGSDDADWTTGVTEITLDPPHGFTATAVEITATCPFTLTVEVRINGEVALHRVAAHGALRERIAVPPTMAPVRITIWSLTFVPAEIYPESTDERRLGILLRSATLLSATVIVPLEQEANDPESVRAGPESESTLAQPEPEPALAPSRTQPSARLGGWLRTLSRRLRP